MTTTEKTAAQILAEPGGSADAPSARDALQLLDAAESQLPPADPAASAPTGTTSGAPLPHPAGAPINARGGAPQTRGRGRARSARAGGRAPAGARTSRPGGHKATKAEVEHENDKLRAEVSQLRQQLDPVARQEAEVRTSMLAGGIGEAARVVFGMMARARGKHWAIEDGEAAALGAALAPCLAELLPAGADDSPWSGALLTVGVIVGPRLAADYMAQPVAVEAQTTSDARAAAERTEAPSAPSVAIVPLRGAAGGRAPIADAPPMEPPAGRRA